jgi:hypothetical protein
MRNFEILGFRIRKPCTVTQISANTICIKQTQKHRNTLASSKLMLSILSFFSKAAAVLLSLAFTLFQRNLVMRKYLRQDKCSSHVRVLLEYSQNGLFTLLFPCFFSRLACKRSTLSTRSRQRQRDLVSTRIVAAKRRLPEAVMVSILSIVTFTSIHVSSINIARRTCFVCTCFVCTCKYKQACASVCIS